MHLILAASLLISSPPALKRLHANEAQASSYLKSNWNKYEENYHPNYAVDDDKATAWVEGVDGNGEGQTLTIPVSALKSARSVRLVIFNGYQKSKALLEANAAPNTITAVVRGPGGRETARKELTLARKLGAQSFDIPVNGGVADVALTIQSVHKGRKYQDTCISDVQVFVDSDVPYQADVEDGKKQALLAWKKERLEAARYFAKLPREYPYVSPRLEAQADRKLLKKRWARVEDEDKDGYPDKGIQADDFLPLQSQLASGMIPGSFSDEEKALMRELAALAEKKHPKDARWYSMAVKGKTTPPDGFPLPEAMDPLFHLQDASLFEANGPGRTKPVLRDRVGYQEGTALSNMLILEGTTTDVKKAYLSYTRVTVERTAASSTVHVLVRFSNNRPTELVTWSQDDEDIFMQRHSLGSWKISWEGGKVSRLERHAVEDETVEMDGPNPDEGLHEVHAVYTAIPRA